MAHGVVRSGIQTFIANVGIKYVKQYSNKNNKCYGRTVTRDVVLPYLQFVCRFQVSERSEFEQDMQTLLKVRMSLLGK